MTHEQRSLLCLWDRRTVFVGRFENPLRQSQGAATLTVSLDSGIQVFFPDHAKTVHCHSLLLPPGKDIELDTGDATVMICYLDPLGEDYAALIRRTNRVFGTLGFDIADELSFQQCGLRLLQSKISPDQAYLELDRLIGKAPEKISIDPRVCRVLTLIKNDVEQNTPAARLAAEVGMSVPRLMQIFKQQIGIPIRRYRQWHRLFVTASEFAHGLSLTNAAMAAGFSDSSHLHHAFYHILGMKPSAVLSRLPHMRVYAPASREHDVSLRYTDRYTDSDEPSCCHGR